MNKKLALFKVKRLLALTLFIVFVLQFQQSFSQVSLNNRAIDSSINVNDFSFIITGHIYGDGVNQSGYPASTFLGNMDFFEDSLQAAFICFTGDVFRDVKYDYPFYKRSAFDKMEIPLYNAVGNHDLSDDFYQEEVGETYFSFTVGKNVFIILDAESDDSQIVGDQFDFFESTLNNAKEIGAEHVFIFSHRPIWAETNPEFEGLFSDNTRSTFGDNFIEGVYPELDSYQHDFDIFWLSGSMGNVPVSFFYHKEEDKNITYIQTAIRNIPRDAILEVKVKDDQLSFIPHSLTGQHLEALEYYNMDFWKEYQVPVVKFNYRLIPLYIKQTLTNRMFWYGMGAMVVVFFLGGLVLRRVKKRVM